MPSSSSIIHWICLITAVIACSSGGVWFLLLRDISPLARSWWRLLLTAILQIPGFIVKDWKSASQETKLKFMNELPILAISGLALAIHFGAWSGSLQMTSLSHSLLFVCTTPLLIVGYRCIKYVVSRKCCNSYSNNDHVLPPTLLEVIGTIIGFIASIMLAAEAATGDTAKIDENHQLTAAHVPASLAGDAMATLGAAAMGIYLNVGAKVRQWMPIWMYVFPVTLIAALLTALASIIVSGQRNDNFLFLTSSLVFGISLGSAVTAGILGHTLANYAVPHVGSLVVSIFLLWEPFVGSLLGFICGLVPLPGPLTFGAGIPLICGAALVVCGKRESESYVMFERVIGKYVRIGNGNNNNSDGKIEPTLSVEGLESTGNLPHSNNNNNEQEEEIGSHNNLSNVEIAVSSDHDGIEVNTEMMDDNNNERVMDVI
jgi:drug/metabolite transporter (DMT)-like permease